MPVRSSAPTKQPQKSLNRSRSNSPKLRRSRSSEDVQAATSLPPSVEGPLRCFLQVEVSKLILLTPTVVDKPTVRLKWWGEKQESRGTVFRPKVFRNKTEIAATDSNGMLIPPRTTSMFPVKSGQTQILSYLRDMSTLSFELHCGNGDSNAIARCNIHQITQLSFENPISGCFAMYGADSEKVAQLNVALCFKDFDKGVLRPNPNASQNSVDLKASLQEQIAEGFQNYGLTMNAYKSAAEKPAEELSRTLASEDTRNSVDDLISFLIQRGSNLREALVQNEEQVICDHNSVSKINAPLSSIKSNSVPNFAARPNESLDVTKSNDFGKNLEDRDLVRSSLNFHDLVYKFDKKRLEGLAAKSNIEGSNANDVTISDDENTKLKKFGVDDSSDSDNPIRDSSLVRRVLRRTGGLISTSATSTGTDSSETESELGRKAKSTKKTKKGKLRNRSKSASSDSSFESEVEVLRKQEVMLLEELNSSSKADKRFNRPDFSEQNGANGFSDDDEDWTLSIERFNLLQSVSKAMVVIDSFTTSAGSTASAPGLKLPPKVPFISKHAEYYVEFSFPTCMPHHRIEMKETKVNCRSANPDNGNVTFSHRSVFPLCIGAKGKSVLKELWTQAITFHLYLKTSKNASGAKLVGSGAFKLKDVLEADFFSKSISMPLKKYFAFKKKKRKQNKKLDSPHVVGSLKLSVELTSDLHAFTSKVNELKVKEASRSKPLMISLKEASTSERNQVVAENISAKSTAVVNVLPNIRVDREFDPRVVQLKQGASQKMEENHQVNFAQSSAEEGEAMFFFLTIGQSNLEKYVCKKYSSLNVYAIARVFFSDDWIKSDISWGSDTSPHFNVCFTVPFVLTPSILQRMKNNYVIIEVWNKLTTAGNDELIGLVKVPTSQFHLSFANQRLMSVLREAHYPVVAGDNTFPIVHPSDMNKSVRGKVAVTLAIGSSDQVAALKHIKMTSENVSYANKSVISTSTDNAHVFPSKELNEHTFEVMVSGLKSFNQFSDDVHGEADCYVQYTFPDQENFNFFPQQGSSNSGPFALRKFKTSPTLCVPDVVFHDVMHHKLVCPNNLSLPSQLLKVIAADPESEKTLKFEVWTRHYHPNLRDQMVATCQLPLPKLWSLITMHSHTKYQPSCQNFVLPLTRSSCVDLEQSYSGQDRSKQQVPHCGVLEATVSYKVADFGCASTLKGLGMNTQVVLRMNVIRACGLEEAAIYAAQRHPNLEYYSKVGLNSFFKVSLSFADPIEARTTRSVAQSFAPETGSVMEIPLPVYFKGEKTSHVVSLAERLENEFCIIELWHQQSPSKAEEVLHYTESKKDCLLASCSIPLRDILYQHSGIRGWHALHPVDEHEGSRNDCTSVGGVDVQLAFVRNEDQEKVIQAGRGCGWKELYDPISPLVSAQKYRITVCLSELSCNRRDFSSTLLSQNNVQSRRNMKCYLRYKFYDKPAICTHSVSLRHLGENSFVAKFDFRESVSLEMSEPLKYYLKEEPLEFQLWAAGDVSAPKGHRRDKYLGSAYMMLTQLARSVNVSTISESCTVYKPGASYIGMTQLRASITLEQSSATGDVKYVDDDVELNSDSNSEDEKEDQIDLTNTFKARVEIDRAYHLELYNGALASEINTAKVSSDTSSLYFTFQMVPDSKPVTTTAVNFEASPKWNFQTDTFLSYDYLKSSNPLLLKLWLQMKSGIGKTTENGDCDKVFGFVAVDLSPLNSGFSHVDGFYNVTNFSNQVLGQVKLSIIPMDGFQPPLKPKESRVEPKSSAASETPKVLEEDKVFMRKSVDTSFHWGMGYPIGVGVGSSSTMDELKRHLEELELVKDSLRKKVTKQLKQADVLLNPSANGHLKNEVSMVGNGSEAGSSKHRSVIEAEQTDTKTTDCRNELEIPSKRSEIEYGSRGHGDREPSRQISSAQDNAQQLLQALNAAKEKLITFNSEAEKAGQENEIKSHENEARNEVHDESFSDLHIGDNESEAFSDGGEANDVTRSREFNEMSREGSNNNEDEVTTQRSEYFQSFGSKSSSETRELQNHLDEFNRNEVVNKISDSIKVTESSDDEEDFPNLAITSADSATYTLDKPTYETQPTSDPRVVTSDSLERDRMTEVSYETTGVDNGKLSQLTTFRQLDEEYGEDELLPFDRPQESENVEALAEDENVTDQSPGHENENKDDFEERPIISIPIADEPSENEEPELPLNADKDSNNRHLLFANDSKVVSIFSPLSSVDVGETTQNPEAPHHESSGVTRDGRDENERDTHSDPDRSNDEEKVDAGTKEEKEAYEFPEAKIEVDSSCHLVTSDVEVESEKKFDEPNEGHHDEIGETEDPFHAEGGENNSSPYSIFERVTQESQPLTPRLIPEVTLPRRSSLSSVASSSSSMNGQSSKQPAPNASKMPSVEEAKRIARIFSTKYS